MGKVIAGAAIALVAAFAFAQGTSTGHLGRYQTSSGHGQYVFRLDTVTGEIVHCGASQTPRCFRVYPEK